MDDKRVDYFINPAQHYRFQLVKGQVYAMVRHPALGIVVSTDTFAPVPGADLTLAVFRNLIVLILLHLVQQTGPQHFEGLGLVLMLRFLILT